MDIIISFSGRKDFQPQTSSLLYLSDCEPPYAAEAESMASTLSLVKLPILSCIKTRQSISKHVVPLPSKFNIVSTPLKFSLDQINIKQTSLLSLSAITFPFFLDTKASILFYSFIHIFTLLFSNQSMMNETGCTCCWWRVWDI